MTILYSNFSENAASVSILSVMLYLNLWYVFYHIKEICIDSFLTEHSYQEHVIKFAKGLYSISRDEPHFLFFLTLKGNYINGFPKITILVVLDNFHLSMLCYFLTIV